MSIEEWGITIFSLIYLYFAIKNNAICFIFGIIASSLWAVVSFNAGLKFDTALQIFYVFISILGIYRWRFGGKQEEELPISTYPVKIHFLLAIIGCCISGILIYLSQYIEIINFATLDAITTVFMIIGTLLLIERKLESWLYLILADIAYIYIYINSELYLLSFIMLVYIIFGSLGYFTWKHKHAVATN